MNTPLWQAVTHGDAHQDKRKPVKRIVVHCMAEYLFHDGEWMHATDFLNVIGLSAHAFVTPDGTIIRQRQDHQFAYHAKGHNADSLGIEALVEGRWLYDAWEQRIKLPYVTEPQMAALVRQCREWERTHGPLVLARHSDIDPERKPDPGAGFHWSSFVDKVRYQHLTV